MLRRPKLVVDALDNELELTQRISKAIARPDRPRPSDQGSLSMCRGRKTPDEVFYLVRKGGAPDKDDGAAYTTAGALRRQGFKVDHDPTRRNPDHVSVTYPGDWDDAVALLFMQSFSEEVWNGEVDGNE